MKRLMLSLSILALVCVMPVLAADEDDRPRDFDDDRPKDFGIQGWGLRFGAADGPDQVVAGAQWDFGEYRWVHLEPNVEVAFGDDITSLTTTMAVHYRFRYVEHFRPYAGAGIGVGLHHFDPPGGGGSDTDFDIGFRLIGGFNWALKNDRDAFIEISTGIGFPHDVQLMAGWTF